nr:DUF3987 domain-containing protein [uncultured Psychroserpens sp.]
MQDTLTKYKISDLNHIEQKINNIVYDDIDIAIKQLDGILSKMPVQITRLINDSFNYKRVPKEYSLSSILFAFSNASGLAFNTHYLEYTNYPNLYFAIVGSRGDAKSEAMRIATNPLKIYDDKEYDNFKIKDIELKKSIAKQEELSTNKVIRNQLLLQNATIEAMHYTHYENPYSIGLYTDELDSLIEKMANKNSQEGNLWRIFFLQGYTNTEIDVRRKVADSFRIKQSYPTLLGSIQHQFIPKLFANGNLESGFIDRLLFVNNLTKNNKLSNKTFPKSTLTNYSSLLQNLLNHRDSIENQEQFNNENKLDSIRIEIETKEIKKIRDYVQNVINEQIKSSDYTNEYMAKMQISIHKLVLLVHLIKKSSNCNYQSKISANTVDLAILINEFYFTNFKIVLKYQNKPKNEKAVFSEILKLGLNNKIPQKTLAKLTGLSTGEVSKRCTKLRKIN